MIHTTSAPKAVAYFNVFVPVGPFGSTKTREDARRIVDRYLYEAYEVIDVVEADEQDGEPADSYCVKVRGELGSNPEYLLKYQRDRLSSGMYLSSEPVIYVPVEVTA